MYRCIRVSMSSTVNMGQYTQSIWDTVHMGHTSSRSYIWYHKKYFCEVFKNYTKLCIPINLGRTTTQYPSNNTTNKHACKICKNQCFCTKFVRLQIKFFFTWEMDSEQQSCSCASVECSGTWDPYWEQPLQLRAAHVRREREREGRREEERGKMIIKIWYTSKRFMLNE